MANPALPNRQKAAPENLPAGALISSAQVLTFQPGLYSVEMHVVRNAGTVSGFSLPLARIDQLPSSLGRATVAALADGGWLSATDNTVFIRVVTDVADILLTTYRTTELPAPELRIKAIRSIGPLDEKVGSRPSQMHSDDPPATPREDLPLAVLAHIEKLGDVTVGAGEWAGAPKFDCSVEGFSLVTKNELSAVDLEYQAILGDQWQTPWFRSGEFCGSRGMSLALKGFRVRVIGAMADVYCCRYWGNFGGETEIGPVQDGSACANGSNVLTALRIELIKLAPVAEIAGSPTARRLRRPGNRSVTQTAGPTQ